MELSRFERLSDTAWQVPPTGKMRVPAIIYAAEDLIREMDDKVYTQVTNVATLPGVVRASYAMPAARRGYGLTVGGGAAFEPDEVGVELADALYATVPVGVGSTGKITLDDDEMTAMLAGGARWAVERGYGRPEDLERIEENGRQDDAKPSAVSAQARKRQRREMGTLGS